MIVRCFEYLPPDRLSCRAHLGLIMRAVPVQGLVGLLYLYKARQVCFTYTLQGKECVLYLYCTCAEIGYLYCTCADICCTCTVHSWYLLYLYCTDIAVHVLYMCWYLLYLYFTWSDVCCTCADVCCTCTLHVLMSAVPVLYICWCLLYLYCTCADSAVLVLYMCWCLLYLYCALITVPVLYMCWGLLYLYCTCADVCCTCTVYTDDICCTGGLDCTQALAIQVVNFEPSHSTLTPGSFNKTLRFWILFLYALSFQ